MFDFKQDDETTTVIFRMMNKRHGGYVIALFPELTGDMSADTCSSYVIVGQHGAADPQYVMQHSRKATVGEYGDMMLELQGAPYGYRLRIMARLHRRYRAVRATQLTH